MEIKKNQSNNSIGQRIKELRLKKGLRQTEFARLVGCAPNTVTEWEKRSGRAPGKRFLGKVADILEISSDYLFGIENKHCQIPCYGDVSTHEFKWVGKASYYIEIPSSEYSPNRFGLNILDDLLEPVVSKGDYAIFDKVAPEDGDIVVVRFSEEYEKAMIKRWRNQGNLVMLSETNLEKIYPPYFFEFSFSKEKGLVYTTKQHPPKQIIVEGKLVSVKRSIKVVKSFSKINYIIS